MNADFQTVIAAADATTQHKPRYGALPALHADTKTTAKVYYRSRVSAQKGLRDLLEQAIDRLLKDLHQLRPERCMHRVGLAILSRNCSVAEDGQHQHRRH